LNSILEQYNKNLNRLTSGTLLWTDDPASQAVYEKLESHIRFLSVNIRNYNDLIFYYQSREGYLEVIINSLQKIRVLILKRSNSFYNSDDIEIIDSEINMFYEGILKTISQAQFNTIPMFSSWMDNEELINRFKEADFYTLSGIDRILQSVITERSRQGAVINTLKHRTQGLSTEQENSINFLRQGDTDFALELSNLKRLEILFFSNIFLLEFQK